MNIDLVDITENANASVVRYHTEICDSIKDVYARKNADYGDSFARGRKKYPDYVLCKLYDKFSRLENLMTGADRKVDDESIEDTLLDLANYAIMELAERKADADR